MKTWVKIVLGLFLVGLISAFLVYKYVYNKPHPDFESMAPDFKVGAKELYTEFTTNQEVAGKKYNGKVVEISGALTRIETADTLVIAVFACDKGAFGDVGVRCTMSKKYNLMTKQLPEGYALTIKGYCTGFLDDVSLEQCSIVR